jgi:hypothetical protein
MAKRGINLFRRNDGLRALRIARDGGIDPAMLEIVAKDGTVYRVYGENAVPSETDTSDTSAWAAEAEELKAKTSPKSK